MKTRVLTLGSDPDSWATPLKDAAEILLNEGLVAFPTETVYGLGANALSAVAVQKIYSAKGRPSTNPIIVHVLDIDAAKKLTSAWPDSAQKLAQEFWPGPLTLIVPKAAHVPDVVTGGGPTVAIRVPSHPVARALLQAVKLPIAAPSANISNSLSATTASHVLKGLDGKVELILDGGATTGGLESTVVDCSSGSVRICRPGLITSAMISSVVPTQDCVASAVESDALPQLSPGMLARHYAPRVPLVLAPAEVLMQSLDKRTGVLLCGNTLPAQHDRFVERLPADSVSYSAGLYAALHRLEEQDIDRILVQNPPPGDEWLAVHDRLMRAETL